ncbi:MAG: hypothetical protein Q8T04_03275, partial [Bacteroidota bacterium]|nr:hypothetical protein [Bacteroidota bacterium]
EIYKLITERIIGISGKFDYTFDSISTPAIEEHHQNIFPERYESQLIFLLRDCILVIPEEELNDKISELLKSSIPVFNRVAIHTINEKYDLLSELFWEWKKNPLHGSFKYQYKHELYELLKNHADKFDAKQVERILGWIEEKEYFVSPEADKELANKIIAYQKKEWLSSILNNKDKRIEEQYKIYETINDAEPSHPGFDIWHGEAIVGYTSPLTYEQIESYSFAELIDYFEKYKSKSRSYTGPSIEGLSDIIISTIKQNPEKYCDSELIAKASYQLQYTWSRGLIEAFREKSFDIQSVLQASEVILKDEEFWKINNTLERDNYPNFFLTELLGLIDFGLGKDHETFSKDNLPQVKSLLITVLQKDERTPYEFDKLSMKSLNNSKGKLYSSIFQYLLKFGRDNKEDTDKLKKEIGETVDLLFKTNICDELMYFAFGQFFPFLFTLYPDWIKNNIETAFPKHDTFKFNATLCGYFLYNSRFYLNEFNLLHESGIYEKALEYNFIKEKSGAINNLVSHILIALVEDLISIDDPLMDKIINSKIEQHQSPLIHRFWSPKRALIDKEKLKVVPLYIKIISNELSKEKIEQNTQLISGLSKWFNSMDKIEEGVYELQLIVSDRVKSSDKHHYLEGLRKHVNVQPEMVGNLLFALFENGVEYDISRGIISNLTEKLYQAGLKDIADKICLLHGEKGIDILKDLYKRNQN